MRAAVTLAALLLALPAAALPWSGEVRSSPLRDADRDRLYDDLEARLAPLGPRELVDVVVVLDGVPAAEALPALRDLAGPFEPRFVYGHALHGFSASLSRTQVEALAASPLVLQVEHDRTFRALLDTATAHAGAVKARLDFAVDGNLDGAATYSADDVVVAVVDTGIDAAHLDLDDGKVIAWRDFVAGLPAPYDDNGHGTHVASIAAGDGEASGGALAGVAPGAALVGVKVMNAAGLGTLAAILAGFDWVVANRAAFSIEVLSVSLGTDANGDGTSADTRALDAAVAAGLTVTVAAGNTGSGEASLGTPADGFDIVAVGAMADPGEAGWMLAYYSSRGYTLDGRVKPDLAAPGDAITAAMAGSLAGYQTFSGTSMAAPFVAGAAALVLHASPGLGPAQVKAILQGTAVPMGQPGKDIDYGAGRLDVHAAVDAASVLGGSPPAQPAALYGEDGLEGTGAVDTWSIQVADTAFPLVANVHIVDYHWPPLLQTAGSPEFDLYLYAPDGGRISADEVDDRQIFVCEPCGIDSALGTTPAFAPGTYRLAVVSANGAGDYVLDVSVAGTLSQPAGQGPEGVASIDTLTLDATKRGNRYTLTATAHVVDASGQPLPDARVLVFAANPDGSEDFAYGYTGAGGTLQVTLRGGGQAGTFSVTARDALKVDHPWDGVARTATRTA